MIETANITNNLVANNLM